MTIRCELAAPLLPLIERHKWRYKVAYGGRGAAKSWGFAEALLMLGAQEPLRILCAREVQRSIRDSVHALLCDTVDRMQLDWFYTPYEMEIRGINGTMFGFAGLRAQNVQSLRSWEGADICWVEEGHTVSEKSWRVLTPTIRNPGSEIWVSFNPELDSDPAYKRFVVKPPARALVIPISYKDNPWLTRELEEERVDLKARDPEAYRNVWLGECRSSVEGAVYAGEISNMHKDKRYTKVTYDPLLKVHRIWDLGWNDAMTIIMAQRSPHGEIRVIDYIEDSHRTYDSYFNGDDDPTHECFRTRRYNWGYDFLPHDSAAHSAQTGMNVIEIIDRLGGNPYMLPATDIEAGIKLARMMFARTWFDDPKANELVDALKRYRRAIPANTDEEPARPVHDSASHGADAYRKMAEAEPYMTNSTSGAKLDRKKLYGNSLENLGAMI